MAGRGRVSAARTRYVHRGKIDSSVKSYLRKVMDKRRRWMGLGTTTQWLLHVHVMACSRLILKLLLLLPGRVIRHYSSHNNKHVFAASSGKQHHALPLSLSFNSSLVSQTTFCSTALIAFSIGTRADTGTRTDTGTRANTGTRADTVSCGTERVWLARLIQLRPS